MVLVEKGGTQTSPKANRADAIDQLGLVTTAAMNPARKRAPQPSTMHPWNKSAAWTQSTRTPQDGSGSGSSPLPMSMSGNDLKVPRASQPLRVEPPPDYNAPARAQRLARASSHKNVEAQVLSSKLARRPLLGNPTAKHGAEKMRDYAVLAHACQRAGRQTRAEHLTFNQGVLYENMGEDGAALRCYKELLRASLDAGDAVGEALACNCIGVALQLKGGPEG